MVRKWSGLWLKETTLTTKLKVIKKEEKKVGMNECWPLHLPILKWALWFKDNITIVKDHYCFLSFLTDGVPIINVHEHYFNISDTTLTQPMGCLLPLWSPRSLEPSTPLNYLFFTFWTASSSVHMPLYLLQELQTISSTLLVDASKTGT